MRTITAVEGLSLDGVLQSPSGPDEDPSGGFSAGGWAAPLAADPAASQAVFAGGERTSAMLFGRRTYDRLVGFWLSTPDPNPFTGVLRETPKHVAAHRADGLPHPNSFRLEGDAIEAVRALKADGEGSGITVTRCAVRR